MAATSVAVESRSRPSTMKIVLEAMQEEDGKSGVSVQEIKRRILAKYPEKQEARLRNSLKKAFEKALADGTIVRVRSQAGAGSALTGSFRIADKKPPARAPAKKSSTATTAAASKGKENVPKIKVTSAPKEENVKKPAAKKKSTAKAPVKKTVSGTSTASTASSASSASAASFSSYASLESSPRAAKKRGTTSPSPSDSPNELRTAAPRQKKAQSQEGAPPTGKENVPPGSKATAKKKKAPAPAAVVEAAVKTAVKPGPKKTKAKAGPASKVAGK